MAVLLGAHLRTHYRDCRSGRYQRERSRNERLPVVQKLADAVPGHLFHQFTIPTDYSDNPTRIAASRSPAT